MSKVSTSIILDKRIPLKDNTYRVKLRVTYQRKQVYFPTKYALSEEDFDRTQSKKPRADFKELSLTFSGIETRAIDIIDKLPAFTFEGFEKKFLDNSDKTDVFVAFDKTVLRLETEGRVGTASSYECARNSLICFVKRIPPITNKGLTQEQIAAKKMLYQTRQPLPFINITVDFLKAYEKWMEKYGRSRTTIGIYLRPLKALFNEAIANGDIDKVVYPFGKGKHKIPAGQNVKKALELEDIALLFKYQSDIDNEKWAQSMWILTYLANGINMKDIARLKFKDIDKDHITFIRAKTELTTSERQKAILVSKTTLIENIITRWGNQKESLETYVFPILKPGLTPKQEHNKVRDTIKKVNTYMRRIAEKVGIEKKTTTYVARHSMATVLNDAGVPLGHISDLLGHGTEKTTKNYVDSIKGAKRAALTKHLTPFLEENIGQDEDELKNIALEVALRSLIFTDKPFVTKLICIKSFLYEGGSLEKDNVFIFNNKGYLKVNSNELLNYNLMDFKPITRPLIFLYNIAALILTGTANKNILKYFKAEKLKS